MAKEKSFEGSIARVAVAAPLHGLFDYRVGSVAVSVGCRVRVSFGRSTAIAVVAELVGHSECPDSRLKAVDAVLDESPLLDVETLGFLRWVARYYHHPVGEVIAAALPVRLRRSESVLPMGEPGWQLTADGIAACGVVGSRAPRQADILSWLLAQPDHRVAARLMGEKFSSSAGVLRTLRQKSWLVPIDMGAEPDPAPSTPATGLALNSDQRQAFERIAAGIGRFSVELLDGVTGSGKTEVYLQLAERVVRQGMAVLVLVPEISLTPQLLQRFGERLGSTVRVVHSGLGDRARELNWHRVRTGLSRVLLGTRSSVFTPIPRLGLVIVDEEHDSSFKQTEGFRYSARDLAIVRAQRAGCPVVLGSATPSLESLRHALSGRYRHLQLKERAGVAEKPAIELLDVRDQPLQSGMSQRLLDRVAAVLQHGEQVMLFLNRRGYAPLLSCYACGWLSDCPRCDARQTLHRHSQLLWCHHCGSQQRTPKRCPACGVDDLHPLGQGTEQLEEFLAERFPGTPLIRVDRDATARKGSLEQKLQQVHAARAALLVGTQMLAKGHHFPRVTLVGVLDADAGLYSADFRATERMAQLLVQVAGRAGRGERPGQVLIQTRYPDHPLLQTLVKQGYREFAGAALAERESAAMPPYSYQALLRAEAREMSVAQRFLEQIAGQARDGGNPAVEIWGPVPAPMARRAGKFRCHLLLQAGQREALHRVLAGLPRWVAGLPEAGRVRWSLDIDPIDLY